MTCTLLLLGLVSGEIVHLGPRESRTLVITGDSETARSVGNARRATLVTFRHDGHSGELGVAGGVWNYKDGPEAAVRAFNEIFSSTNG